MTRVVKNVQQNSANCNVSSEQLKMWQTNKSTLMSETKAGSVHDMRRCAVSSLLRVPPQYTTFNEKKPRLPLHVTIKASGKDHKDQVIVLQTEDIELDSQAEPRLAGMNPDSANQSRCTSPGIDMVASSPANLPNSRFVLINGFDMSRLLKLAKKWTLRRRAGQGSGSGSGSFNGDHLPLEEMQKNGAGRHKRASL